MSKKPRNKEDHVIKMAVASNMRRLAILAARLCYEDVLADRRKRKRKHKDE